MSFLAAYPVINPIRIRSPFMPTFAPLFVGRA